MADIIIPQGATTPVTPAQDLQINLAEVEKIETQPETWNLKPETDFDLNLDIDLPEAPKNDDRLKTEDQKNIETDVAIPVAEKTATESTEVLSDRRGVSPQQKSEGNEGEVVAEALQPQAPIEQKTEVPTETKPEEIAISTPIVEPKIEEPTQVTVEPSKTIEEIPTQPEIKEVPTSAKAIEENIPESSSLKNDQKMIDELEWHASAGGLAPEAIVAPQPAPVETPKTFDLDAMLGGPINQPTPTENSPDRGRIEEGVVSQTPTAPSAIEQKAKIPEMPSVTAVPPQQIPAFTIPTTTSQVPVQAVMQTNIPHKKNMPVKALLFVVLFVSLGFTTFFILKTMYPLEFSSIFGGQTQMHASEEVTGAITELTGTELSGTELSGEQLSGEIDTGTGAHESAVDNAFWELNDLWTTDEALPEETDLSRLTEYITQGNTFLTQGKAMGNNTVIKYGLYISKKATSFLEKIANGEEINNLSWYFAQFDQYIAKLKELVGQTTNPDTTVTSPEQPVSPTPPATNDVQEMTDTASPTTDTGITSQ